MSDIIEGRYKAFAQSWGMTPSSKSGSSSRALNVEWVPFAWWSPGKAEWQDWSNPEARTVSGNLWLIGKNGQFIKRSIETLRDVMGYTGKDFSDFADTSKWTPNRCQITVEPDEYNEKVRLRVAWINSLEGGGGWHAGADDLKVMQDKFGGAFGKAMANEPPEQPKATDALADLPDEVPF